MTDQKSPRPNITIKGARFSGSYKGSLFENPDLHISFENSEIGPIREEGPRISAPNGLKRLDMKDVDFPDDRFETLLAAMLGVTEQKTPSADQASDGASDAYCDDTQTPPDTSEDASR